MPLKPTKPAPKKLRVPNAERSAETRRKLLNATIDCLFEVGYHQTSTVLVTKRANVSRGSMLHHFPSKADLIMATSDYIVELRRDARAQGLAVQKTPREKFLVLVDIFWGEYTQRTGVARVEILLGARSDPELGPRFQIKNQALDENHKVFVRSLLAEMGLIDDDRSDAFVELYVGAIRGLAIQALWPHNHKDVMAAVEMLKAAQLHMLDQMIADVRPAAALAGIRG